MKKILYPQQQDWPGIIQRPVTDQTSLHQLVNSIFKDIGEHGDEAVKKYCRLYDGRQEPVLKVDAATMTRAINLVPEALKQAIQLAAANIERFHAAQKEQVRVTVTAPGVLCWQEDRAIEKVGLYIPGGTAPLFSTVLMLGIPAKLAGCKEVILCTPADPEGNVHPAILYTASLAGISTIYAIGGIQAIGAMAIGTETIPKVDKLFGPGNQYVTAAKQIAQLRGTAIDMPAGPSEVLIIADPTCNPSFVAADLLSQAEHGADSQVMLLSDKEQVLDLVLKAVREQTEALPRKTIVLQALQNSSALLLPSLTDCVSFSNAYAPEHLILALENAKACIPHITHAGSVFIGNYSCESAGDYASGTNHTLPTNGAARSYSGLSLASFMKKVSFQELTEEGIRNIGPAIALMAEAEELYAHKNAVTLRLNN